MRLLSGFGVATMLSGLMSHRGAAYVIRHEDDGYYDSLGFYRPSTHRRTERLALTSRFVMCELVPQLGPIVDTTPESKRAKRRRIARAARAVR